MRFRDLAPKVHLSLERDGITVIAEREARLLEAVDRVHSIKDAAREAGLSYRTAWSAIQEIEKTLGRPVVTSRAGGAGGGGTTLTDECRDVLEWYRELHARLDADLTREGQASSAEAQPA
ncbi:MAG: winged helix-turn-helix domain-containing protein [Gemmatimonadales bacterium]